MVENVEPRTLFHRVYISSFDPVRVSNQYFYYEKDKGVFHLKKQKWYLLLLLLAAALVLGACGGGGDDAEGTDEGGEGAADDQFSVAMVTDIGGVDDKSFNQSAWKGLQDFGAKHGLEQGDNGYDYLQSNTDADYIPNLNQLVRRDFDLIYGIGFMLSEAIQEVAQQNPDVHFGIVDEIVEMDNVVSLMFREQEVSFLAGVAAALTTETGKVGFVGGMESEVIKRFEAGFRAGVKSVDPEIEIIINYVGSFGDIPGGQQAASAIYNQGADIIFHASGATGNGVFAEAKELVQQNPDKMYWVIGVDSDQYDEGAVNDDLNVTLTSALKRVDVAVADVAERAMNGDFPGGETLWFGLDDNGVELATTGDHIPQEHWDVIKEWEEKIKSGEITPPGTDDELKAYFEELGIEE